MSEFSSDDAKRFEALLSQSKLSGNTVLAMKLLEEQGSLATGHAYLGIGAGDGELEHHLAVSHDAQVGYVDPSDNLAGRFQMRMRDSGLESRIKDFSVTPAADAKLAETYHCAVAIHSWYYIGYEEPVLAKIMASLKPGGSLSILVHARDALVPQITGAPVHAEQLLAWVQAQGYPASLKPCSETVQPEHFLNPDGSLNARGRKWISYLLKLDESAVPPAEWTRCRELLAAQGRRITFKYGWIKVDPKPS